MFKKINRFHQYKGAFQVMSLRSDSEKYAKHYTNLYLRYSRSGKDVRGFEMDATASRESLRTNPSRGLHVVLLQQ